MVKVSVNRYVSKRIANMKVEMQTAAEKLRVKLLKNLEEIFKMAGKIVKGEVKHQRVGGKMVRISMPRRKRWLKVAEHAAKTIQAITQDVSTEEIKARLEELEKLVYEASSTEKHAANS